jgi:Fe-S cluster biogenesis protein NfuA
MSNDDQGVAADVPPEALAVIRKAEARVRAHGGEVSFTYDSATASITVELSGSCRGCPALPVTYAAAFWGPLLKIQQIDEVKLKNVRVGEATLRRIVEAFDAAPTQPKTLVAR